MVYVSLWCMYHYGVCFDISIPEIPLSQMRQLLLPIKLCDCINNNNCEVYQFYHGKATEAPKKTDLAKIFIFDQDFEKINNNNNNGITQSAVLHIHIK